MCHCATCSVFSAALSVLSSLLNGVYTIWGGYQQHTYNYNYNFWLIVLI